MSKKFDQELLKMDLYELLEIKLDADEALIKKSYRKKALSCHPDRNPDNPEAATQFIRLKKILEILLDPGARSAYDKVLKGRKAAAIRVRESNAVSQKLRHDLERREQEARLGAAHSKISEEERLRRELKRLEEEGEKLIAEELEKINREVELDLQKTSSKNPKKEEKLPGVFRIKVRWIISDDCSGYTKEEIQRLFYKWGDIAAVAMQEKGSKCTALVEYASESGANMAVQFEKGLIGRPLEVCHAVSPKEKRETKLSSSKPKIDKDRLSSSKDFESLAVMNQRREAERKRLIEEMLKNDL